MPELPDVIVYLEALEPRVVGQVIEKVDVRGISVLKTYDPPIDEAVGNEVVALRRLGKRLVFELTDDLFLVIHLMVGGRLKWAEGGAKVPGKVGLAGIHFANGSLILTEASKKKRAALWLHRGEEAMLAEHDRGGAEPLEIDLATRSWPGSPHENRTLKRALTDPAYLPRHRQCLLRRDPAARRAVAGADAPISSTPTRSLGCSTPRPRRSSADWLDRLRAEVGDGWPTRSPPSGPRWSSTASSASRARCAAPRYSASRTPRTR